MSLRYLGLLSGAFGLLLLIGPFQCDSTAFVPGTPVASPKQVFATYEQLWRAHVQAAADKLASGDIKTEQEAWDFIAAGQEPARKAAFKDLAKSEQDYFVKQGGWSAKAHEKLLRSYAK